MTPFGHHTAPDAVPRSAHVYANKLGTSGTIGALSYVPGTASDQTVSARRSARAQNALLWKRGREAEGSGLLIRLARKGHAGSNPAASVLIGVYWKGILATFKAGDVWNHLSRPRPDGSYERRRGTLPRKSPHTIVDTNRPVATVAGSPAGGKRPSSDQGQAPAPGHPRAAGLRWGKGICPVCGKTVKVRWDGVVWAHRGGLPDPNFNCRGSRRPPKEATG